MFNIISVVKREDMKFVRQLQTVKVTNVDNKVHNQKEVCTHENMLPISIRGIICGPSNCGKTNVLISLLESPHGIRFENVYVYTKSKVVATAKILILGEFISID